ncbi:uncharacterized protein [Spinacia oleracea]|uniref:Uncharacterized protein n=1 Tax=Spinacia oleracea TaxID=3562 RepID=A0A9R0JHD2_SPIOL|nr:uncharacterized protein LOC110774856 [Spinacia oleracea]
MGDLMKRQFNVLDLSGHNFLEWTVDAQMNLKAQGLDHTIKDIMVPGTIEIKTATEQEKAKATVLITYKDFKSVSEYNSTLFKIVSLLKYCDQAVTKDQMIEKTLSTFHANNIVLQQQYRERDFKKYSELISILLVAEQKNDLLLKNHNLRPTGSMAFNESTAVESSNPPEENVAHRGGRGGYNHRGRGRGNHRGRGRGRGHGRVISPLETITKKGINKEIKSRPPRKKKTHALDVA